MLAVLLGGLGLLALTLPASADAHGIVGKANLPIPVWLFSWTAAIVLVVSFVALSTMWTRPQLQDQHLRRLFKLPAPIEWLAGLVGVALFALVIYSGFDGAQVTQANFSVTFIYVVFWVGVPVASVLFGDVFRALSPWRTCGRVLAALVRAVRRGRPGRPLLRYPSWLGVWPATAVIVGFAWLELVYVEKDHPATLAALSLAYFLAMLAGMALFGVEEWSSQADGFGVYFNLLSKLSALVRRQDGAGVSAPTAQRRHGPEDRSRHGRVHLRADRHNHLRRLQQRRHLAQQRAEPAEPLRRTRPSTRRRRRSSPTRSASCSASSLILAVYRVGIFGVHRVSERYDSSTLTRTFAHSLVPIAFAYVLAHYFSLLIWQSQAMVYLASDPLGNGANLFGTSGYQIDYHVISYAGDLVRPGGCARHRPRGRPGARARPRAGALQGPGRGGAQPVLDARGDGRVHQLRACGCSRRWGHDAALRLRYGP